MGEYIFNGLGIFRSFHSWPLRRKLIAAIIMICAAALLLASIINMVFQWNLLTSQEIKRLEIAAEAMSLQLQPAIEFMDLKAAKESLESLRIAPFIDKACVYDEQGRPVANYIPAINKNNGPGNCPVQDNYGLYYNLDKLELYHAIYNKDGSHILGSLYLSHNLSETNMELLKIAIVKLSVIFLVLGLMLPVSRYLQRVISSPAIELLNAARSFSKDISKPIKARKYNNDEIGELADSFNMMMAEIHENRQELIKTINELREEKENAKGAKLAKSEFFSNLSHEIRTPLNAVVGLTHVLARTQLTDRQKEYVDMLRISSDNLISLINDLLDLARLEDGSMILEAVEFDILDAMNNVLDIMGMRAQEKKLQLLFDSSKLYHRHYNGDPLRLQQVVTNLVSNAVKFTETGYVRIILSEYAESEDSPPGIKIEISDSGIGIEEEKLASILDKFANADAPATCKYGGAGRGLAISQLLVAHMGGRIEVQSTVGVGSVFSIFLPL